MHMIHLKLFKKIPAKLPEVVIYEVRQSQKHLNSNNISLSLENQYNF